MSRFFIDRPIFASVLSIVITLTGGIALKNLALALYPPVSPPNVSVSCSFAGADARTVSESVASPIEEQVNGVENMLYMSSSCTNDGQYNLTITFEHGVDLNLAQIRVQNRVSLATPKLPDVIKQTGVLTRKRAPDILMSIALVSPIKEQARARATLRGQNPSFWGNGVEEIEVDDGGVNYRKPPLVEISEPNLENGTQAEAVANVTDGVVKSITVTNPGRGYTSPPSVTVALPETYTEPSYDQLYLSNYALLHLKEEVARVPGVGDISMFGQKDYSIRIWVDPEKLASRNMTAGDVVAAIREQNIPVPTGQVGQPPVARGQSLQMTMNTKGRLIEPEEFGDIIIKQTPGGRLTRIRDVARVELGAKNEDQTCQVNHLPASSMGIFQLPDANALDTADLVRAKLDELSKDFPPGVEYQVRYDTTPYIRESINEVFKTLREAVILVAIVVLLFLQNWRSALIPLVAVPVAIIGTFGVMLVFGFSLNNLTLFGLVLAIGIVVDDAIVVVEAVEHHIEHGMSPRDATVRAMDEVSGPVIAIGLVLSAVFVPCAFITGITGQFFRQFALTIASSTLISAFNSLTLSPALAALLLRPRDRETHEPLPRLAYVVLGAWFGFAHVAPELERAALERPAVARLLTSSGLPSTWWMYIALGMVACMAVGWLVSRPMNALLGGVFRVFNAGFNRATGIYTRIVGLGLRLSVLVLVVYGGMSYMTYSGFLTTPKGFIPSADMGYLLVNMQLPDSASLERTIAAMDRVETMARPETPGVKFTQAMSGNSLVMSASGSNFATLFIVLDEFTNRPVPLVDRFFRLIELNATEQWWRKTLSDTFKLGLPPRKPDLEERTRAWINARIGPESWIGRNLGLGLDVSKKPSLASDDIAKELRGKMAKELPEADVKIFPPPPVRGVGRAGGFNLMIEDRGDAGINQLQEQTEKLATRANKALLLDQGIVDIPGRAPLEIPDGSIYVRGEKSVYTTTAGYVELPVGDDGKVDPAVADQLAKFGREALIGCFTAFRANVPQFYADVNRWECMAKDVDLQDLFTTLRVYLGSLYVNDFNRFGRTWQVIVQGDQKYRRNVEDIKLLKVRSTNNTMVPVAALADIRERPGPLILPRYNMYSAASITGNVAPGISSGQSIKIMEALAKDPDEGLPPSMAFEWTELAFFEMQAGNTAMVVFGVAVLMVFLVLAAQYESWALPLAVILVVPMCLLSAISGVKLAKEDINIFTQIGFVVLVGLASKNAILIVEFAKYHRDKGESRRQATLEACRLRLRPIVMTSLAFILGVLPLLLGHGAGAEMRRTLGTTVFSGMLGVTLFGIFLTPVFFYVIDWLSGARVWNSPLFRWVDTWVLGTLSLRPLRQLARQVGQRRLDLSPARTHGVPDLEPETRLDGESDSDLETAAFRESEAQTEPVPEPVQPK